MFILCKTSNPTSSELQSQILQNGDPVYIHMAKQSQRWGNSHRLGLVVGATDTTALRRIREVAPSHWILSPGVGYQKGDLAMVTGLVLNCCTNKNYGIDPLPWLSQRRWFRTSYRGVTGNITRESIASRGSSGDRDANTSPVLSKQYIILESVNKKKKIFL